jgi:murein L,D-transpeptidase YcbB/YkuD
VSTLLHRLLVALLLGSPALAAAPPAALVQELLAEPEPVVVDREPLDVTALRALYADRGASLFWAGDDDRARTVATVLGNAAEEGLEPAEYHPVPIAARLGADDPRQQAELDVLLSDALLSYASDVRSGRLRPLRVSDEIAPSPSAVDPVVLVRSAAEAGNLADALAHLAPSAPAYVALREALAAYRRLAAGVQWPAVPDGPKLTPGMVDPAVPMLRHRLVASGDLPAGGPSSTRFDDKLAAGVRAFQARHGLPADGVVGARTRAALNVSAQQRVEQIVLNLERQRWLPADLGARHVTVNIAGFWLRLVEDGTTTLEMPVVVGRSSWETPVFSSAIADITFNPRWIVPAAIAREELLPKIRHDPEYVGRHGILVRARQTPGTMVDPDFVDWRHATTEQYRLVQAPGPENPLGRIKFNVPNPFGVYLHDAPSHDLFRQPARAFSHGCVRVGKARELAAALMTDMPDWSEERREAVLADWTTHSVHLRTPMPLHVTYQTAWVDEAGHLQFVDDVYGRDQALAEALTRAHRRPRTAPPAPLPSPTPAAAPAPERRVEAAP